MHAALQRARLKGSGSDQMVLVRWGGVGGLQVGIVMKKTVWERYP